MKILFNYADLKFYESQKLLNQYPPIDIDEKSTYPTILDLHKKTN